ncbi:hypothetical protein GH714_031488 [Hevea brasiliensis]|uniref:Uncharacterized protein n=1 Tax=Hevea brasiliensis TaxID=3981 RepID=A0A6A6M666_HEVBR|nr:hypothetical protein GH714_031488 [Hevea brasiliensis]
MELALSLGDTSKPFKFLDQTPKISTKDPGFCMGLETGFTATPRSKIRRQVPSQIPFPWLSDNLVSEPGSTDGSGRGFDVNRLSAEEQKKERVVVAQQCYVVISDGFWD